MEDLETKDIVTFIGILLTFLIGVINFIVSWKSSEKTAFVNSVTTARQKWMDKVRDKMTEFCTAAMVLVNGNDTSDKSGVPNGENGKKPDYLKEIFFLPTLMKLLLNRADKFDTKIMKQMDKIQERVLRIIENPDENTEENKKDLKEEISELISLTQDLLKLEWEGVKEESTHGRLSKETKLDLYNKYLRENKRMRN
jgi:hypothetical protein